MSKLIEQSDGYDDSTMNRYLKKQRNKCNRLQNKRNCKDLMNGICEDDLDVVSYNRYQGYST
jgi:hypothetical protein